MLLQMTGDVGAGDVYTLWGGAWDPHDLNRLVTAGGNGVQVCKIDLDIWFKHLPDATAVLVSKLDQCMACSAHLACIPCPANVHAALHEIWLPIDPQRVVARYRHATHCPPHLYRVLYVVISYLCICLYMSVHVCPCMGLLILLYC